MVAKHRKKWGTFLCGHLVAIGEGGMLRWSLEWNVPKEWKIETKLCEWWWFCLAKHVHSSSSLNGVSSNIQTVRWFQLQTKAEETSVLTIAYFVWKQISGKWNKAQMKYRLCEWAIMLQLLLAITCWVERRQREMKKQISKKVCPGDSSQHGTCLF